MAVNIKRITPQELDRQREFAKKTEALLNERYDFQPLACVVTYGCQQNVADSEHIKGMLSDMGYGFTDDRINLSRNSARNQARVIIFTIIPNKKNIFNIKYYKYIK